MVGESLISQMHELPFITVAHANQILNKQAFSHEGLIERVLKGTIGKDGVNERDKVIA